MKQVLQSIKEGRVSVADLPSPMPAKGEVLVQVAASLVSAGTERMVSEFSRKSLLEKARSRPDLVRQTLDKARKEGLLTTCKAVRSRLDQPLGLGYSCAGTVLWAGEGKTDLRAGDRVACAGSGYALHAQTVSVPHNLTARIPDSVDFESAAFTTLGAIALQGVRLADSKVGESAGVIGLGVLGQLTVMILKAAGCRVAALDLRQSRARLAGQMGADAFSSDAEAFKAHCLEISNGKGVDSILITADTPSNQPVELAAEAARDRAAVVAVGAVGTQLPRKPYFEKELDFRISRSYGPGRYDPEYEEKGRDYPIGYVRWTENRNMQAFLQLLAEGRVSTAPLVTHRFPIDRADEAYQLITSEQPGMGVLITYPQQADQSRRLALRPPSAKDSKPVGKSARRPIRVGLIGAGAFAAGVLLPAMKSVAGAEFVGACSARGLNARHVGSKFGFEYCTSDEDEIFADDALNTVVICTRHHLHCRQIIRGLEAFKQVFCEKPPCLNEQELAAIARARLKQRRLGRETLFMVGYNRRFAPMAQRLKSHLAKLHEPLVMHCRINGGRIPPEHWVQDPQTGGGRVVGEVCHFVDLLTFLAGSQPIRATAVGLPNLGRYCSDNLTATLEFADGSVGSIVYTANGDKAFAKERVEVFGQGLAAYLEDFRMLQISRNGRKQAFRSRLRQDKGHRGEWQAFVDAARSQAVEVIPFQEIVSTSLTTFRIAESMRSGKAAEIDARAFLEKVGKSEDNPPAPKMEDA